MADVSQTLCFSFLLMPFFPAWSHFTCFSFLFIFSTCSIFMILLPFLPSLSQTPCSLCSQYLYSFLCTMVSLKSPNLVSLPSFPCSTITPWTSECCGRNIHDPTSHSPHHPAHCNQPCLTSLGGRPCSHLTEQFETICD